MSESQAPRTRRRVVFLALSAAIAVGVMIAAHEVMLPFIVALVLAYVLAPLVAAAEKRGMARGVAVILVYVIVLGSFAIFVRAVAPRIGLEFRNLRREMPRLSEEARTKWVPVVTERLRAIGIAPPEDEPEAAEPAATSAFVARPGSDGSIAIDVGTGIDIVETKSGWLIAPAREKKDVPFDPNRLIADAVGRTFAYAQENSLEVARAVQNLVTVVSRAIFVFFITLMLAAYLMITRERIYDFLRSLFSRQNRDGFDALMARVDQGLSGVVRGQLVICGINGVLSAVGFAFIHLKYWPVMALVAATFSLIPIFGSIASAVPAVAVGLTQGLPTAFFVLAWIVGVHQLEANLLNPKIMGDAAKLHPVLVIFALLVGEHFFHTLGALLAVPTMSIAQSLFLFFEKSLREPAEDPAPGQ
jgi:predicted PurR-regulated permease PerM